MNDLESDGLRWRALMSCDRIRVIGSAKLGKEQQHLGLELWEEYPFIGEKGYSNTTFGREQLTLFADTIIKNDGGALLLNQTKQPRYRIKSHTEVGFSYVLQDSSKIGILAWVDKAAATKFTKQGAYFFMSLHEERELELEEV